MEYLLGFSPRSLTVFKPRVEHDRVLYREVRLPEAAAESYLEDRPPPDIAYEVASKVGARLGIRVSSYVKRGSYEGEAKGAGARVSSTPSP